MMRQEGHYPPALEALIMAHGQLHLSVADLEGCTGGQINSLFTVRAEIRKQIAQHFGQDVIARIAALQPRV
jgi:hypothetical protein